MGVMDSIDKYTFNTLIIFLSLALGTNLASAYQHFAQLVKYGILAMPTDFDWSFRQDPHFRQIIGLRTVIRYMFRGLPAIGKKRYSLLFTSLWLFFNLATAVGISLIGLTYSLETLGAQTVGEKPGYTSVVDLAHFYPSNVFNDTLIDQVERFSAKLFGDVSTGFKVIKPGQPSEHDEFNVIELGDGKWQYAFKNMDRPGGVMRKSDRTITTHASCKANKITSLDFQNSAFTTVDADNNTKTHDILFSGKATTYFSRSVDISEEGDENYKLDTLGCEDENPRCATVEVVQVVSYTDPMQEGNWYFKCESVVEEVVGAKKDQHKLVDRQAKIAAAAISHSGVFWSVYEDGSDEPVAEQVAEMGYYMQGVVWGEVVNGDTARMASMIARFSAGCIAATDQLNPRVNVYGMRPWAGVALSVKWWRLHAVILALIGVQLVGGMFCLIWWMLATKGKKSVMEPVGV
ncbi:hypothetical protein DFH27DRAFT_531921 [Peziza echinospora]|nr:hypothetical protein DFH27DRAFT_531921 [Peziza echinospora]